MFAHNSYQKFLAKLPLFFPNLNQEAYQEITQICSEREICGVIRDGTFIRLNNYSKHFETALIDMSDLRAGDILFHTHASENSSPVFSKRDILTGKRNNLPLLLYHPTFKQFDFWTPDIPHPYPLRLKQQEIQVSDYLNLPYQWVRSDCYSFSKDVARGLFSKGLPEIYNKHQTPSSLKYFFLHPEKLGFKRLCNFREGCFVLLKMSVNIPFHMGIVINVYENNNVMMLHQVGDGISSSLKNLKDLMGNVVGIYDFESDPFNQNKFQSLNQTTDQFIQNQTSPFYT